MPKVGKKKFSYTKKGKKAAKQSSELFHIKESVDEIKDMVKEQNGRVRKLEQQTSAIKAIGSSVAVVFSAVIGWLFNTRS